MKTKISINVKIQAPIKKVWKYWTSPNHITNWNFASDEWCCPSATNDLKPGGNFAWRMEAKDGSMGFDFTGTYEQIEEEKSISYKMSDGRNVSITFSQDGDQINLTETFEAEGSNADELQRKGWLAILGNFKKYVELN